MLSTVYRKCKYSTSTNIFTKYLSYSNQNSDIIMGIETSCDDTGCGIVDIDGNILGESLNSQQLLHLKHGGINPIIAQEFHRKNIELVVTDAVTKAGIEINKVSAIAVTVNPGLALSLIIGLKYAKYLHQKYNKPIIPINHMEAHALMARMDNHISFPFLTLLISGGNCLLALVNNVNDFILLGESLDGGPGEAFDKAARRIKLVNIEEFSTMSGGQAIERAAMKADNPTMFDFPPVLTNYKDCNFSFSGLKSTLITHLLKKETEQNIGPDDVIPDAYNLCASFQFAIAKHICQRTQRAMEYLEHLNTINGKKTLVISGGVACNNFIYKALQVVCQAMGYSLIRPHPRLCTDNGVMIAWNGMEKWKKGIHIFHNASNIDIAPSLTFSKNMKNEIASMNIKCNWIKLNEILK